MPSRWGCTKLTLHRLDRSLSLSQYVHIPQSFEIHWKLVRDSFKSRSELFEASSGVHSRETNGLYEPTGRRDRLPSIRLSSSQKVSRLSSFAFQRRYSTDSSPTIQYYSDLGSSFDRILRSLRLVRYRSNSCTKFRGFQYRYFWSLVLLDQRCLFPSLHQMVDRSVWFCSI